MDDFNPHLRRPASESDKGGPEGIEVPDQVRNIAWQTRPGLPSIEENALADALQAIFADEVHDLPRLVERLNQAGVKSPAGAVGWSEENFRAELRRLGA